MMASQLLAVVRQPAEDPRAVFFHSNSGVLYGVSFAQKSYRSKGPDSKLLWLLSRFLYLGEYMVIRYLDPFGRRVVVG